MLFELEKEEMKKTKANGLELQEDQLQELVFITGFQLSL
jgi:hypothetical protein